MFLAQEQRWKNDINGNARKILHIYEVEVGDKYPVTRYIVPFSVWDESQVLDYLGIDDCIILNTICMWENHQDAKSFAKLFTKKQHGQAIEGS